jgi:hypothetical protein
MTALATQYYNLPGGNAISIDLPLSSFSVRLYASSKILPTRGTRLSTFVDSYFSPYHGKYLHFNPGHAAASVFMVVHRPFMKSNCLRVRLRQIHRLPPSPILCRLLLHPLSFSFSLPLSHSFPLPSLQMWVAHLSLLHHRLDILFIPTPRHLPLIPKLNVQG